MWKFPNYHLLPTEAPARIPPRVTRVLNLRGAKTPSYAVPSGVRYQALFFQGGPKARVPFWKISKAVKYIRQTEPGSICLVHCQHGLNRTGLVACAVAAQELGLSAEEAMVAFAELRPSGNTTPTNAAHSAKMGEVGPFGVAPLSKKSQQPNKKNGRVHRPSVLHHRSEAHFRHHFGPSGETEQTTGFCFT